MKTGNASTVDCGVCCREIPLDAAFTPEGADYVMLRTGLLSPVHRTRRT